MSSKSAHQKKTKEKPLWEKKILEKLLLVDLPSNVHKEGVAYLKLTK